MELDSFEFGSMKPQGADLQESSNLQIQEANSQKSGDLQTQDANSQESGDLRLLTATAVSQEGNSLSVLIPLRSR